MNAIESLTSHKLTVYKSEQSHPFDDSSDSSIWTAFKAGDKCAFEFIFKDNYELLLNYGLKLNSNEDDVKDCIQLLFSKLWESRMRLGQNNSIKSYLLASLRRMILRGIKSRFKFLEFQNLSSTLQISFAVENRFFKDEREKTQAQYLNDLLQKLPLRQREAIFLKYYGEHKFSEIADIMGISTRVVYKLIYKAMANLTAQVAGKSNHMEVLLESREV
ncbi:MAG: sigma-70 family RNA polymerase sigma factor [Cyclobacteriaceae bacterium]